MASHLKTPIFRFGTLTLMRDDGSEIEIAGTDIQAYEMTPIIEPGCTPRLRLTIDIVPCDAPPILLPKLKQLIP
jgi:hypothetical protein